MSNSGLGKSLLRGEGMPATCLVFRTFGRGCATSSVFFASLGRLPAAPKYQLGFYGVWRAILKISHFGPCTELVIDFLAKICYSMATMPTLADNKKARFDYDVLEKYEAGLVLTGQEVKAAKNGQMKLAGAFVSFYRGDAYLTGAHISKYQQAGPIEGYDPEHSRRLLLKKKEIKYLQEQGHEKGLTVVPLSVYTKERLIKIEIAVGRGRKQYDKREVLKKRDLDREMKRQKF